MCCAVLSRSVLSDSFATPWTVAHQAPSMGFSRQEYWSGLPCPPPGDRPSPGIEQINVRYFPYKQRFTFNLTDKNGDYSFHNLCSLLTGSGKDVPPFGKKTTIRNIQQIQVKFLKSSRVLHRSHMTRNYSQSTFQTRKVGISAGK